MNKENAPFDEGVLFIQPKSLLNDPHEHIFRLSAARVGELF